MRYSRIFLTALGLAAALWLSARPAESQDRPDVAAGSILVASRDMRDPNFEHTVILVVSGDDDGVMGLVLNRRTNVAVSRVFDAWKEARGHSEPVFLGGPVEPMGALALIRSRANLANAHRVLADIHLTTERTLLIRNLPASAALEKSRIYMGYTGWAPEQLDNEIELGAWHVFPGNPDVVFDPDPETLWDRMIRKTDLRIARLLR